MNEYGIESIGSWVPDDRVSVVELGQRFDATSDFLEQKVGFTQLARLPQETACSDLCVKAFEDLVSRRDDEVKHVDCAIVVTQNPDGRGLPHASAIVHEKLGLDSSVACFDISLGCTGFVHAMSIAVGFMKENAFRRGLLFTADPYSLVIDESDRDTALLFGDAGACCLISDSPSYVLGRSVFATRSRDHSAIHVEPENDHLRMNGFQVFRYVAQAVPGEIRRCLEENGRTVDEVDLFLLHQGSKFIVDTIAERLGVSSERAPFLAKDVGNTVSSTIPLMLQTIMEGDSPPANVVAAGFGVGLSSCVTFLQRERPHECA